MIFGRRCPHCKERVKRDALICRYCHKELEPLPDSASIGPMGFLVGLMGITAGAALALVFGFYRERQRWKQGQEDTGQHGFGE